MIGVSGTSVSRFTTARVGRDTAESRVLANTLVTKLTLSGSSAHTLRPGLARSGNTHSFDGFANTLPADEEVSLLSPAAGCATAVELAVDVEAELGRDVMVGRAGMATLPLDGPARLEEVVGGREVMLGVIDVLSGLGTATDMADGVKVVLRGNTSKKSSRCQWHESAKGCRTLNESVPQPLERFSTSLPP